MLQSWAIKTTSVRYDFKELVVYAVVQMTVQKGDWVKIGVKGIWRVERAVPDHYEPRYRLADRKQLFPGRLFVVKRLLSEKWKPAFEATVAEESLVKPLGKSDVRKLESYVAANAETLLDFKSFVRPVDAVLNLSFGLPRRSDYKAFKNEFVAALLATLEEGMTSDAVLKAIAASSFAPYFGEIPSDATLQLICKDHEVRRRNLVYRELMVHNF